MLKHSLKLIFKLSSNLSNKFYVNALFTQDRADVYSSVDFSLNTRENGQKKAKK